MYKVLRRNSPTFPKDTFTLWYEVDFDGDNHEWRECVSDVLAKLSARYKFSERAAPPFEPKEDFVELTYEINDQVVTFSCDFLLYSVFVTASTQAMAEELANFLGQQVGWVEP